MIYKVVKGTNAGHINMIFTGGWTLFLYQRRGEKEPIRTSLVHASILPSFPFPSYLFTLTLLFNTPSLSHSFLFNLGVNIKDMQQQSKKKDRVQYKQSKTVGRSPSIRQWGGGFLSRP